jgi:membrane-associated phospholipid phosphatase
VNDPKTLLQRWHHWLETHLVFWLLWKLLLGFAVCGIVSLCYFNVSHVTLHRSHDLMSSLDRAIPFVPWTWWFYFPGYLFNLTFCILVVRHLPTYYRGLAAILLAQTLCTLLFFLIPSIFPRPLEAGPGWTGDAIRWFWTIDPPNNTFPSAHVAISFLAAITLHEDRHPLRWVSMALALAVVITVHTTKQHYLLDAIGGLTLGYFSYWVVFRWWPQRRASLSAPSLPPSPPGNNAHPTTL